ncbi:MAG: DUF3427 domain-containing protein [Acidobacteria bacterium]|nr:DUF3427 domain-containing protein [Acidobacteriota bacterium]
MRGLYERLVTEALAAHILELSGEGGVSQTDLRNADAADRVALHVSRVVQQSLESVPEKERASVGVGLARRIVQLLSAEPGAAELAGESPATPGRVLHGVFGRRPDGTPNEVSRPLIPLLDTTLLTNAPGEPAVGSQIREEIPSADRIDLVMAFIRRSGIRPLLPALEKHAADSRPLRILTTIYTGSTEASALDDLTRAGAQVRLSYDISTTRLHAKAWLFHRDSGFPTAYIGSSNLTHSALVSGLEWNVRVSGARNPAVVEKIAAVFETYWNSGDFVPYDREEFLRRSAPSGTGAPFIFTSPIELRLEPFQERLLEEIALSRENGHHRNLLAAATGTGKTVMAAVDYARLSEKLPRARLLFVAHRREILEQSLATFRHALRDHAFGELWVDGLSPERFEHVFASIQSLSHADLDHLEPGHFDVVIVDEFHHAAAPSYRRLLEHVSPVELLGLTATPERSDGLPILEWFDHRIAAELRLWDAIDQHRLVPFSYFGIADGTDLRQVPWRRAGGYDVQGLTNLYTANDALARHVVRQLTDVVDDCRKMRALGFCVSVEHARFMARVFTEEGLAARAVWADSTEEERRDALRELAAGRVQVVFSVDLFNEGIDVPGVDTLLLLRPTDSPTLFLQQLGRGLRKHHGKSLCTVLDFVGHHRREFRYDRRFRALVGGTRKELERQIQGGFPFLPAGCSLELDAVAREQILENLRTAVPERWTQKVDELRALAARGGPVDLATYLQESGLELEELYGGNKSWSDLLADAGEPVEQAGPHEIALRRACGRLLHIDDRTRIDTWRRILEAPAPPDLSVFGERERRLARMLVASVLRETLEKTTTVDEAFLLLWNHPQIRRELGELLGLLEGRIDHVQEPLSSHPGVPLRVHARYTRDEILAAFGVGTAARVAPWQTGVYWAAEARTDLLAFTLDKTSGQFSPTTRYRDYAIRRDLIHWESQSLTRAASPTGLRYQKHVAQGSSVVLFARLRADSRAFWCLGPATYVSHEGETPMAITWRLATPLPGDLFAAFAAAVA